MAQLQDLCLTAIERTGTDTQEVLSELKEVLPPRMWSRHPILKIVGSKLLSDDEDDSTEVTLDLTIEYTGVYRLTIKESLETFETLDSLLPRLDQLIRPFICEITLRNPTDQEFIAKIATYNPAYETIKKVFRKIRPVLRAIPKYIHV